ncbi:MAG TPA: hypothetical protein VM260_23730, partial [Pirellula sp.]|nr:hypothetical protein [Pirellula sp.]
EFPAGAEFVLGIQECVHCVPWGFENAFVVGLGIVGAAGTTENSPPSKGCAVQISQSGAMECRKLQGIVECFSDFQNDTSKLCPN